jgi:SOS response associated peptidase (SRAP)
VPYWAKDLKVGFANINAKAEGIENRPAFREAFQRRRCLVPVDNFYEWKKTAEAALRDRASGPGIDGAGRALDPLTTSAPVQYRRHFTAVSIGVVRSISR